MSSPAVHSVHIYDEHSSLIKRLCGIVSSGLQIGNSVLVVATASHRDQLVEELNESNVDVRSLAREGRFTMYDAKEMLATFMVDGRPDRELFSQSLGKLLSNSRKKAHSDDAGLTVFGEMVAVLWEEGKKEAALEIEGLWNDALNDRAFHLHCAYPRWNFLKDGDESGLAAVCHAHSYVLV
jgi:hypothetical protein